MKKIYLILFIIVALAGFLRFFQLGTNPPSTNWDETAWGYNAYSLGIDGRDEFGRFLPHDYFESFGDFKPPMYAYLDVIPVKIFGLNEFATRFPSVFLGTLAVLLTFILVRRIFPNSKNKDFIAILSALFLAISPWHIMLSRGAFEANVASFFIILGVWSFLTATQDRKWYLVLSAIVFALSFYIFNTARIVSPILVISLAIIYRKKLFEMKKVTIISIIFGILVFLPTFKFLLTPQASLRFQEVNIFSDINIIKTSNQEVINDGNTAWSKAIHNRRLLYITEYIKHYFDNLNPAFLFINGDGNTKFSIQTVGQMYIWDIIFFAAGIAYILKKKEGNWWLVPLWLLIGIIPAATARETPHALRIESSLPMFQILTAYGFTQLTGGLKKYKNIIIYGLLFLLSINFLYFYHGYLYNYKYDYSQDWQYGYKQSIEYVKSVENKYDSIQITTTLGRPYIYYLFHTKTKPNVFRESAVIKRDVFGFVTVESFGKYTFPKIFDYSLNKGKKVLYINAPEGLPSNIKVQKVFYLLNGQPALVAYTL